MGADVERMERRDGVVSRSGRRIALVCVLIATLLLVLVMPVRGQGETKLTRLEQRLGELRAEVSALEVAFLGETS